MKRLLCAAVFFSVILSGFSQTKLISHKSHSGSIATFGIAVENNLFDIGASNFGEAPQRDVVASQLDSVIFLSGEKVIMVTSEYCRSRYRQANDTVDNKELWQAGRDTVYSHQLFSQKHSLDSIKRILKTQYNFRNDIDKVVFIGYDNDKRAQQKEKRKNKKKKGSITPPTTGDNSGFPPKGLLILILVVLSVGIAFTSYLRNRQTTLKSA